MRARERGSALVLVVVLLMITTVFGALLLGIPKAAFDRQVLVEDQERAYLAADAGVRDALVALDSGALSPSASPVSRYSSSSPQKFGNTLKGGGFWYTVTELSGSTVLEVDSYGKAGSSSGSRNDVIVQVQAILKRPPPPTGNIPGALTAIRGTPAAGQTEQTFKIDGNGQNNVTGIDANPTSPPPGNIYGVAFVDYSQAISIDKSKNWNPWDAGTGVQGQSGGNNAINGNSITRTSNAGDLSTYFSAAFASPSPTNATVVTVASGGTYNISNYGSTSSSNPGFLILKPQGSMGNVLNVNTNFYGVIAIDMSGVTGFQSLSGNQSKGIIEFQANSAIHGLAMIDGKTGNTPLQWDPKWSWLRRNGMSGGLYGAMAMKMNAVGEADVHLADLNGQGAVSYGSLDIANAVTVLTSSGYSIVMTRVVK